MHGRVVGDKPHDAECAEDGQAADDGREAGGNHTAEDEEQQNRHQGNGRHLGALLVLTDGSGQFTGQRLKTGLLYVDAGDSEAAGHLLVVIQDGVVVVALELDRHEGVLLARIRHVRQQLGVLEVPDRPQDLVRVVVLGLREVVEDLLAERGVVDGLAVRRGVDRHDMARGVTSIGAVGEE